MPTVWIAKSIMQMFPRIPQFDKNAVGELNEIFNHDVFRKADEESRKAILLQSSESKYQSELQYPWDNYFGFGLKRFLKDARALDLGCFTGGRSIAWYEQYSLEEISGIDIRPEYIEAARQFGILRGAKCNFIVSCGESLSFADSSFDAVLSYDVLEHVRDIRKTLEECYRVLKPGGRMYLVFPSYYHPIEHHLSLATKVPCIHWVFSGQTLVKAYWSILNERGVEAEWYKRISPELEEWERCHTINGTTRSGFCKIVKEMGWTNIREYRWPVGTVGRNVSKRKIPRLIGNLLYPLMYLPGIREFVIHRITYILEKPG